MRLIRDDLDQFSRLVAATADTIGLDPSLVEKDYWAVEALRAVHVGSPWTLTAPRLMSDRS